MSWEGLVTLISLVIQIGIMLWKPWSSKQPKDDEVVVKKRFDLGYMPRPTVIWLKSPEFFVEKINFMTNVKRLNINGVGLKRVQDRLVNVEFLECLHLFYPPNVTRLHVEQLTLKQWGKLTRFKHLKKLVVNMQDYDNYVRVEVPKTVVSLSIMHLRKVVLVRAVQLERLTLGYFGSTIVYVSPLFRGCPRLRTLRIAGHMGTVIKYDPEKCFKNTRITKCYLPRLCGRNIDVHKMAFEAARTVYWGFKPFLGHDVARIIARMVHESRFELGVWKVPPRDVLDLKDPWKRKTKLGCK